MRKAMEQRTCDQCGNEKTIDPKAFGPGFTGWIQARMPDKDKPPFGFKTLDFCSVRCAHMYLGRTLNEIAVAEVKAVTEHSKQLQKANHLIYNLLSFINWGESYASRNAVMATLQKYIETYYPKGMSVGDDKTMIMVHADGSTTAGNLQGIAKVQIKKEKGDD